MDAGGARRSHRTPARIAGWLAVASIALFAATTARAAGEGGTAGSTTAATSSAAAAATPAKRMAVTHRTQPVFWMATDGAPRSVERVRLVSESLRNALEAPARAHPNALNAEVRRVSSSTIAVLVRGYTIAELGQDDARVSGHPSLDSYGSALEQGLTLFVADQRRRATLQGTALHAFFALLIALAGILLFRLTRHVLHRADLKIDERVSDFRPITVLDVPIVGAEAVGAAATFVLAIGRILAYAAIAILTVALSLYQFQSMRPAIRAFFTWASSPLVSGVESLIGALPGLGLALLLVLIAQGAVRVIRLLLANVASGRTSWRALTAQQAMVLQPVATLAIVLLVTPLVIAAAFGQFHTPIELLMVSCAGVVALSSVPLLASGAVGLAVLWRGHVSVGDRIEVRGVRGTVVRLTAWEIELETRPGERARVPTLSLLASPVKTSTAPAVSAVRATLKRSAQVAEARAAVERAAKKLYPDATVACTGFSETAIEVVIRVPASADAHVMVLALADVGPEVQVIEARVEELTSGA